MTYLPKYQIELKPLSQNEGGGYLAWVPDLPGCMSDGETPTEALANVEHAIVEWLEEAARRGAKIPEPSHAAVA